MRCRPNLPFPALLVALALAVVAAAEPVHVVDLLLVRYPAGWGESNARADFEGEARVATARANAVFQASGANVRLRLAGVDFAGWDGSQADFLSRGSYDSFLHALRDRHHADLVCGVTWRSDEGEFSALAGPAGSQAFSALTWDALRAGLLPAALAPNFGCRQARTQTDQQPALPYGHGFVFELGGQTYGTIESGAPLRVPLFSSPRLDYQGVRLGIPAGRADAADNVSVLNHTAPWVARFRGDAPRGEPPDVSGFAWIAPTDGSVLLAGQPVRVQASPFWRPAGVSQVEIFIGNRPHLTLTNAPFEFTWTPGPQPETTLFAAVTDTNGVTSVTPVSRYLVKAPNDAFSDRQLLVGTQVVAEAHERHATVEAGEPEALNHPWNRIARSLWWSWTAPADGRVRIQSQYVRDSLGVDGRQRSLTAFTGDQLESLLPFAYAEAQFPAASALLTFAVSEGETIQLRSASELGPPGQLDRPMRVALELQFVPSPPNDDFRQRTRLSGVRDSDVTYPGGWTAEPGEAFRNAWWTWTAPATGVATWEASSPLGGVSILLRAHQLTTGPSLQTVSAAGAGSVRFGAIANRTYELEAYTVFGLNGGGGEPWSTGSRMMSVSLTQSPANDLPENAIRLGELGGRIEGDFAGATAETGNPFVDAPTLWWRWTAPADGQFLVGMDSGHELTVYRAGNLVDRVEPMESPHAARLQFAARSGEEFVLRVGATPGSQDMASGFLRFSTASIAVAPGPIVPSGVHPEFQAFAETEDGELRSVEWLLDGQPLATVTGPPWKTVWTHPTVGTHRLNARISNAAGETLAVREVTFTVEPPRPVNDRLDRAITVAGELWEVDAGAADASLEPGEPVYSTGYAGTLWWSWVAPGSGTARVRLPLASEPGQPQMLAVYAGSEWGNLNRVSLTFGGGGAREFQAQAGQEYRFQVFTTPTASEDRYRELARLGLELVRVPPNDLYANATLVTDLPAALTANTTLATREPNERDANGNNASASVWWKWVAPTSRTAVITVATLGAVPRVSIFEQPRTPIASNQGQFGGLDSEVVFSAVAGRTYYVAADESWARGPVSLTLEQRRLHPNDDPADALELAGPTHRIEASNRGASQTADEPTTLQQQVWYRFVPPFDGVIQFTISSSDQFARAAAFVGGPGAWIRRGQTREDDVYRAINVTVKAAEPVFLSVGTRTARERGGPFTLDFAYAAKPVNDDFANRIVLSGLAADIVASPFGSTHQPAASGGPAVPGVRPDIWYEWTAPVNGLARLVLGEEFTADSFTVFAGTDPARLRPVPLEWINAYAWPARAGETFQLRFIGEYPRSFSERLELTPAPANDDFANRKLLAGNLVTFTNTPIFATREPGEPAHGPTNYPAFFGFGHTVWQSWTAPSSGVASLETLNAHQPLRAAVYEGVSDGSFGQLTAVPFTGTGANGSFDVLAGHTYHLALDAQSPPSGFTPEYQQVARLGLVNAPVNDDFAQRIPLELVPDGFFGLRLSGLPVDWRGATAEPGEPGHIATNRPPRRSVWYSWTAPADGVADAGLALANGFPMLYRGDRVDRLSRLEEDRNRRWKVTGGESYVLAVDSEIAGPGSLIFNFYPTVKVAIETPVPGTRRPPGSLVVSVLSGTSAVEATSRHLDLLVDGVVVRSVLNPGYPQAVELADLSPGSHELAAKFYLNTGAAITSAPVRIEITTLPPANDDFARRTRITGDSLAFSGHDFIGATREPGEPLALPLGRGETIWWEWTASTNGWATVEAFGDLLPAVVGIYSGGELSSLVPITAHWNTGISDQAVFLKRFPVQAGEVFQIQADRPQPLFERFQTPEAHLRVEVLRAPEHDRFARRRNLTGARVNEALGQNWGTTEPGEPSPTGSAWHRSLWWSWTAPADGTLTLKAAHGAPQDPAWPWPRPDNLALPVVAAFLGDDLATLEPLGVQPDPLTLEVKAGNTYQLAFAEPTALEHAQPAGIEVEFTSVRFTGPTERTVEFGQPLPFQVSEPASADEPRVAAVVFRREGSFPVEVTQAPFTAEFTDVPAGSHLFTAEIRMADSSIRTLTAGPYRVRARHDDFAAPGLVQGAQAELRGNNVGATAEPGEASLPDTFGHSLWWSWSAPADGRLFLNVDLSPGLHFGPPWRGVGPLFSVWAGETLSTLTPLANNLSNPAAPAGEKTVGALVTAAVRAGESYRIQAEGLGGYTGPMNADLHFVPAAVNDLFAHAEPLAGVAAGAQGALSAASLEPGEPAPPEATGSLWWRWTAPAHGRVRLNLAAVEPSVRLTAYTGTQLAALQAIALAGSPAEFFVTDGETVFFAVTGNGTEADGRFDWSLDFGPLTVNDQFAESHLLAGATVGFSGLSAASTREVGEPDHTLPGEGGLRGGSLWWSWSAPGSGRADIRLQSGSPAAVFVYAGRSLGELRPVAAGWQEVAFHAEAGLEYRIAVVSEARRVDGQLEGPPPAPLGALAWADDPALGAFRFSVTGAAGQSFAVLASSDFVHWETAAIETLQADTLTLAEVPLLEDQQRFYRLVPLDEVLSSGFLPDASSPRRLFRTDPAAR